MINTIVRILKEEQMTDYLIQETYLESAELFFVKQSLDMRRAENIHDVKVTVYRDFEKDGNQCRGNAVFVVNPADSEDEIRLKCKKAFMAAAFVPNMYYELAKDNVSECVIPKTNLAEMSLEDVAGAVANAIYEAEAEVKTDSYMNSAEIFAECKKIHVMNSQNVDVSYEDYNINGEFVVQCKALQDVEIWQNFEYATLALDALKEKVKNALVMVHDRAAADTAPDAGVYDVVLSDRYVQTVLSYYKDRAAGGYIYNEYSDFRIGDFIQGDPTEVCGELLNLTYIPTVPFSTEGTTMKTLPCITDGVFKNIHTGVRFSSYLNVPATGNYRKIECASGHMSFEEMKAHKGLYVVNFSDFQMNAMNGYYGGEIRLAYLNDGTKITPVTGGSINGNIYDAQKEFIFSKEMQDTAAFKGPKAMLIKNVSVAGK